MKALLNGGTQRRISTGTTVSKRNARISAPIPFISHVPTPPLCLDFEFFTMWAPRNKRPSVGGRLKTNGVAAGGTRLLPLRDPRRLLHHPVFPGPVLMPL